MRRTTLLCSAIACFAAVAAAEEPPVPPAFEGILRDGVAQAKGYLDAQSAFMPFALLRKSDGSTHSILPQTGAELDAARDTGLERDPARALPVMTERVRRETAKGGYDIVAILADVDVKLPNGSQSDAIQVGIEPASGPCLDVYIPYARADDGSATYGERISGPRQGAVFGCK